MDRYSDLYLTESQIHADSKDSDQTVRILWPDTEDEQADLSLRWVNMYFGTKCWRRQ